MDLFESAGALPGGIFGIGDVVTVVARWVVARVLLPATALLQLLVYPCWAERPEATRDHSGKG